MGTLQPFHGSSSICFFLSSYETQNYESNMKSDEWMIGMVAAEMGWERRKRRSVFVVYDCRSPSRTLRLLQSHNDWYLIPPIVESCDENNFVVSLFLSPRFMEGRVKVLTKSLGYLSNTVTKHIKSGCC